MSLRVLIAPDKFKGTLTAQAAAEAIARGWRAARPDDTLELLPISDGGDGWSELLGRALGCEDRVADTVDAAHRPVQVKWGWAPGPRIAVVEAARVVGLAMLPPGQFHPFDLDTYGLGQVLLEVQRFAPSLCLLGIGGSATNDAGFGLARALGWQFLQASGRSLERWTDLPQLARLVAPKQPVQLGNLVVAVDVRNRLLGKDGATRVFGPQKGIRPEDVAPAERAHRRLVRVLGATRAFPSSDPPGRRPGAGAAGGLGFGLSAFAPGHLRPGFEIFALHTGLKDRIRGSHVVVTGEGAMDPSTFMGKGAGAVGAFSRRCRIPCLGLAGVLLSSPRLQARFARLDAIAPDLTTPDDARARAAYWLEERARRTATAWQPV